MIFETWIVYAFFLSGSFNPFEGAGAISLLRMLRLTRICRLVRLLRAVPELMVLIKGIRAACPAVSWTLTFLVTVIYIFSVAFKILCKTNTLGKTYFPSVPMGMKSL